MKILVTQSGMKHSLGMIRSLARQGHEVHGLANPWDKQPLAHFSRYCVKVHRLDQEHEEAFLGELANFLAGHAFDVLIPVGFPVTYYVAKHAKEISPYVHFVVPALESVDLANDKYEIQRIARSAGVPSPETLLVNRVEDITTAAQRLGFPLIIKGRRESGRGIVATAYSLAEASHHFKNLVKTYSLSQEEYPVIQEFIPGWGCGFFAIYDNGECKRTFMHRRIREYPPSGGASCCAKSFHDPRLSIYGRRLLDTLKWRGEAMVEFRYDERADDYKLIEVNAKFWGSLELALAAGADFPGDYVKIATGKALECTDEYQNITYQWLLSGDLLHGLKRPSALPSIIADALNPFVRKDFLGFDDPVLLFMRFYRLLKEILNLILKIK